MNHVLRTMVRGVYDLQKLRIQTGNRIVANYKAKLGQAPGEKEEEALDADAKKILKIFRLAYKTLAEAVADSRMKPANFKGDELISTYTEYALVSQYMELEQSEKDQFKRLEKALEEVPIYTDFLQDVPGIGPAMAGVIISEFDIHKARHVSSLWKYAGLDVAQDGKGRSKRKEHLIEVEYENAKGEQATKMSITYNPWLKTKLLGVLGASFLRAGDNKYSQIYRDYKHRLENHKNHKEKTPGHRHRMAIRYMVKQFLADLYVEWRTMEGLPVSDPYHEAVLGHVHGGEPKAV